MNYQNTDRAPLVGDLVEMENGTRLLVTNIEDDMVLISWTVHGYPGKAKAVGSLSLIRSADGSYNESSGWISVDDRLPEERQDVLCYSGQWGVFDARVKGGAFYKWGVDGFGSPGWEKSIGTTHWQPLPAPPTQEADNVRK